jgi:hypothetical protein
MTQLPEDIIDRITALERRLKQLSTAVSARPVLTRLYGGSLQVTDPDGTAVVSVGTRSGQGYGVAVRRQSGEDALTVSGSGAQPLRIFDTDRREIFSDDVTTGGLARPWLPMLPPQDTAVVRWPQTTSTAFTTVARSYCVVWQPRMRLRMSTAAAPSTVGQVRVLVDGAAWGSVVTTGTTFDNTGPVTTDFGAKFGDYVTVEIQAKVTSGTGAVYAQPLMMHGTQS